MLRRAFVLLATLWRWRAAAAPPRWRRRPLAFDAGAAAGADRPPGPGGPAASRDAAAADRAECRLGQAMLQAAQLALAARRAAAGCPRTPPARRRAPPPRRRQAIADGAGLILGPLTSAETAARRADRAGRRRAGAGLHQRSGAGPAGRVDAGHHARAAGAPAGRRRGGAGQDPLRRAAAGQRVRPRHGRRAEPGGDGSRLPPPDIQLYQPRHRRASTGAARAVSDYADRRGPIDAQIRAARAKHDAEGRRKAAELAREADAAAAVRRAAAGRYRRGAGRDRGLLPYYDVDRRRCGCSARRCGPRRPHARGAGMGGALYAAPDPATARDSTSATPRPSTATRAPRLADLAYDAAAIARVLRPEGGYSARRSDRAGRLRRRGRRAGAAAGRQVRRGPGGVRDERGGPVMTRAGADEPERAWYLMR